MTERLHAFRRLITLELIIIILGHITFYCCNFMDGFDLFYCILGYLVVWALAMGFVEFDETDDVVSDVVNEGISDGVNEGIKVQEVELETI